MIYEFRVRRVQRSCAREPDRELACADDAAACFRVLCRGEARELFMVACLDVRNRVLGIETTAIGCMTGVEVHPRETFRAALLTGAAALVVGHNHPSGYPRPSPEDIALTQRLRNAGELLGVPVLDHVIVTDHDHYSLAENNWQ